MTSADLDAAGAVVLSWLLTYAIHSTLLLAVAALAARYLADHHAWLDRIWKTAVIAPLVTATLHIDLVSLPLGGRWAIPNVSTVTGTPIPAPEPIPGTPVGETVVTPATTAERVTTSRVVARSPESEAAMVLRKWPSIAAAAWLMIALVGVAWYGIRLRRVYSVLGSATPITNTDLLNAIDRLRSSANQRRLIRLTMSAHWPVPLALGRRHIVVPERFLQELDPEQQRAALAHEVAHVARRDPEWRITLEILQRALFFQPLNRLARARLCDSAEFLCDEWAVQQTESPLALAQCLSVVASWWSPADTLPAGVSAMARSDSAMVRRVTRILNEPAGVQPGPRVHWLLIPVTLVAVAAPRVTATDLPAPVAVTPGVAAVVSAAKAEALEEQRVAQQQWTPAEITAARAQVRDYRTARAGGTLEDRWRQALEDAAKQSLTDFWIVYTFTTPTHGDEVMLSDTRDGSFVSSNGRLVTDGPPLTALLNPSAIPLEGGSVAVLLHYRGARADAVDRAGYRSVQLGFDFGRTPVLWLGDAPESESFARVQNLFGQARTEKIQLLLIELASLYSNTDVVAPFLSRLLDRSWPVAIRREAAEGFDHHHDPRSVEILLRVARTDPDSSVRAEAAETIGEVQTPQSIPALTDLVRESPDPAVRHEAAEGFAEQPAAGALPAIEAVIATSDDEGVLGEVIEALGELGDPAALPMLVQTANTHRNPRAQREAVETLGDIAEAGVVDALTKIAWEHRDVTIQREAVQTLGDRSDDAGSMPALERIAREHDREEVQVEALETIADGSERSLHPVVLELAVSGRSARIRREAVDAIAESVRKIGDPQLLDRAQAVIERAIFEDADPAVRVDALDALEELPDERALRTLRDIIARHPDGRVRREAEEQMRKRQ
jgi:HEAT repeat protein/beta-lactamase regulating signal transducer with metallopeptidase domain